MIYTRIFIMKKLFLALGVASMALQSFASTRILYRQNFEAADDPVAIGWKAYRGLMTIASDSFGSFLEINQNGQNGGSTWVQWGPEIFLDSEGVNLLEKENKQVYNVTFEYQIANSNCNQFNSAITLFTNHDPIQNQNYRNPWSPAGYWQNYLFDASQVDDGTKDPLLYAIYGGTKVTEETNAETGEVTVKYSIDYSEAKSLESGVWYQVELNVNVKTREVEYTFKTLDNTIVQSGTYLVPETNIADGSEISMYAEGLNVMLARAFTTYDIDNIQVSFESDYDYAAPPAIALTRLGQTANEEVNLNMRAYTITWKYGDTLHIIGTAGAESEVPFDETDEGAYIYETTTSGTLTAWTTSGTATSEKVSVEVDCTPVVLPVATATVQSVNTGYTKTYALTVDNADVPLRPTIFIDYKFVGKSGNEISESDQTSGVKVAVTEEGTVTITTKAYGYESATTTEVNSIEFEAGKTWDFARLSDADIDAAGFTSWVTLNSDSQSGFNNSTARNRLYYTSSTETEEKEVDGETVTVAKTVYPFGFVSAESTTNVLQYSVIAADQDNTMYFDGLGMFDNARNVGYLKHIGVYNDETANNYNDVTIFNVDGSDFVLANYINNYGGNSNHPTVANDQEYYDVLAGEDIVLNAEKILADPEALPNLKKEGNSYALKNEDGSYNIHYALYRIDTALTKLVIFKAKNAGAVESIEAVVAGDNNWYSIDGVRVAEPTTPGLYIHNGKKIIVK